MQIETKDSTNAMNSVPIPSEFQLCRTTCKISRPLQLFRRPKERGHEGACELKFVDVLDIGLGRG